MSSRLGLSNLSGFQEILVVVLMMISFFAIFYSEIETGYKIGIAILVFSIIFLASMATQVIKQGMPKKNQWFWLTIFSWSFFSLKWAITFYLTNNIFILVPTLECSCWGGRMVQAVACRAALYGFNSHPQLFGWILSLFWFFEDLSTITVFSSDIGCNYYLWAFSITIRWKNHSQLSKLLNI